MQNCQNIARRKTFIHTGGHGQVWRVTSGVFRLDTLTNDGLHFVQLALPGDLLGAETLCGQPYTYTAIAMSAAEVEWVPVVSQDLRTQLISHAYTQQQRRTRDMMALRCGHVRERVAYLLKLLSTSADGQTQPLDRRDLPSLKELAVVLDTASETLCRELNAFLPARVYHRPGRSVTNGSPLFAMLASAVLND